MRTFLKDVKSPLLVIGSIILPVSTKVGCPDLSLPFQKAIPDEIYRDFVWRGPVPKKRIQKGTKTIRKGQVN